MADTTKIPCPTEWAEITVDRYLTVHSTYPSILYSIGDTLPISDDNFTQLNSGEYILRLWLLETDKVFVKNINETSEISYA